MPRLVRSARGTMVDFDLIAIANQLASAPPPVSVNERRQFIDEKDGIKSAAEKTLVKSIPDAAVHEALKMSADAAKASRKK